MAVCSFCRLDMSHPATATCKGNQQRKIGGKTHASVPFRKSLNQDRCGDCNVADGGTHHPGCDQERCPDCPGSCIGEFVPYGEGVGYDHESVKAHQNGPGYPPIGFDYVKGCQVNSLGMEGRHKAGCTFQRHPLFHWRGQQAIGCGCRAKILPGPLPQAIARVRG